MPEARTPEERLAAIEALMLERKGTNQERFDSVDRKLDKLLSNNKNVVTLPILTEAIHTHAESCPSRTLLTNPSGKKNDEDNNDSKIGLILKGYKGLGFMGSMVVLNGMLTVVILKLAGVF
jgi:hypothetical protein